MDEHAVRQALRDMSPRMPGADVDSLVAAVTRAWNAHRDDTRLKVAAVMAVLVDATWPPGYRAGVAHGHRFVTDYFARTAAGQETGGCDAQGRRVLRAVAGTAVAVAAMAPTVHDEGPSRRDHLTAIGDANWRTEAEYAAIAARVGWTHGYRMGNADAAWSAAGRIIGTVHDLLGEPVVRAAVIGGAPAQDWLTRVDVNSRQHSELDVDRPHSPAAQAFPQLRAVQATPAVDAAAVDGRHQIRRHPGRHR
jgi:hypothetical protein